MTLFYHHVFLLVLIIIIHSTISEETSNIQFQEDFYRRDSRSYNSEWGIMTLPKLLNESMSFAVAKNNELQKSLETLRSDIQKLTTSEPKQQYGNTLRKWIQLVFPENIVSSINEFKRTVNWDRRGIRLDVPHFMPERNESKCQYSLVSYTNIAINGKLMLRFSNTRMPYVSYRTHDNKILSKGKTVPRDNTYQDLNDLFEQEKNRIPTDSYYYTSTPSSSTFWERMESRPKVFISIACGVVSLCLCAFHRIKKKKKDKEAAIREEAHNNYNNNYSIMDV